MQSCPDCHAIVDDEAIFCDQCGYRLRSAPSAPAVPPVASARSSKTDAGAYPGLTTDACPACGYFIRPDEEFCVNCGVHLGSKAEAEASALPVIHAVEDAVSKPFASSGAIQQSLQSTQSRICPTCGAENPPGEVYCQICGFWLVSQVASDQSFEPDGQPQQAPVDIDGQLSYETVTMVKVTGRLLSMATNTSLELPSKTEIIIGRRDPERGIYPDVDLSAQGSSSNSVSRQHARLTIQGNQLFIEDMKSTNATYLNRQRIQPGERYLINHGDELRLGGVTLVYYSH